MNIDPFLTWVGGKRKLVKKLTAPEKYNNYYEPFVGGGALYFYLKQPSTSYISDSNKKLMNVYTTVKYEPHKFIDEVQKLFDSHSFTQFHEIREQYNSDLSNKFNESIFLYYLNKTCFAGRYRVNREGKFNASFGVDKLPKTDNWKKNILRASDKLQTTNIKSCLYHEITPKKGDFVYLDPPYDPEFGSGETYQVGAFTRKDQLELSEFCKYLDMKGIYFKLSNSNTDFIRGIYSKYAFNIMELEATRIINSKGKKHKKGKEVIISNF